VNSETKLKNSSAGVNSNSQKKGKQGRRDGKRRRTGANTKTQGRTNGDPQTKGEKPKERASGVQDIRQPRKASATTHSGSERKKSVEEKQAFWGDSPVHRKNGS